MIHCFLCKSKFYTNTELFVHINSIHSGIKLFKCYEKTCSRTYSIFRSFRRHRIRDHAADNIASAQGLTDVPECHDNRLEELHKAASISKNLESEAGEGSSHHFLDSEGNHDTMDFVNNQMENQKTISEINETTSSSHESANVYSFETELLIVIAQLYNNPELSRNTIDGLLKNFFNLFKGTLNSIHLNVATCLLESNRHSDCSHDIEQIFDSIFSTLNKFETESRRFKEF